MKCPHCGQEILSSIEAMPVAVPEWVPYFYALPCESITKIQYPSNIVDVGPYMTGVTCPTITLPRAGR